jgi:hypothetical protein
MQANASLRQPMSFGQFVWREMTVRVGVGVPVLIVALVALPFVRPRPADWWDWADPLISLLTLIVAFFIWWVQRKQGGARCPRPSLGAP